MAKVKYITEIIDGRTYSVITPWKMQIVCCDCGLVHDVQLKVRGKEVVVKLWRNDRSTSQFRRNENAGLFIGDGIWTLTRRKKRKKK